MNRIKNFALDHKSEIVLTLAAAGTVAAVVSLVKTYKSIPSSVYMPSDPELVKTFAHPIVVDKENFDLLTDFWYKNH